MINFSKTFSFHLNGDLKSELEALSARLGCHTHRELFDAIYAGYQANEGDDSGIEALQRKIQVLEQELAKERNRNLSTAGSGTELSQPVKAKPKEGDFVAEVPDVARDKVAEFRKDMFDKYDYTNNWEILRHVIKNHRAEKKGGLVLVEIPNRLHGLIEQFSQGPLDRGIAKDKSHYLAMEMVQHFEAKAAAEQKNASKKDEEKPKEDKGWSIW